MNEGRKEGTCAKYVMVSVTVKHPTAFRTLKKLTFSSSDLRGEDGREESNRREWRREREILR